MAITIVQKSQSARKRKPTIALALSGGAMSGGAFKIGGLLALDLLLANRSVCDFEIYAGISAGSFLVTPLAAGISPQEVLKSFTGRSHRFVPFRLQDFYYPNLAEVAGKGKTALEELAAIYPNLLWSAARVASKSGLLAAGKLRHLFGKGKGATGTDLLDRQRKELSNLADQLPSLASFVPSGVFDNASIERYMRRNLLRARVPNNFSLLARERKKCLYIHAVDLDTAQDVIFGPDERNDASISEAVQASTALPGFYRPALINGRYYIDGSAKQTAPIELVKQKGADLIICYNPFRPFHHAPTKTLSAKYSSMGEMGLSKIIDQSIRTLLYSRLSLAIEDLRNDPSFTGDVVVMEPAESDSEYFSINPLSFWKRAEAARFGFVTVFRDVERNYGRIQELFSSYGLITDIGRLKAVAERLANATTEDQIIEALTASPSPHSCRAGTGS
jgi:predicted acylesterase/phospholipase RssA